MKPLHETTPARIRRVCTAPKEDPSCGSVSSLFPVSVMLWGLGVFAVGLTVAVACTNWFGHYTQMIFYLCRGF